MNILDWIIIGLMALLIVRGIFRGLFLETASLIGVVIGIWTANTFQPDLTTMLKGYLPAGRYLSLVSFAVIFFGTYLLCKIAAWTLKTIFSDTPLGLLDRLLGACFAMLKGIVIIYFVIVLLTFYMPSQNPFIAKSRFAPMIVKTYQSAVSLISPEYYRNLKKRFMGTEKKIKEIIINNS